jgi:peptide/nickel transport system ATP-binding protein
MYLGKLVEFGPAEEIAVNPAHPYTKSLMDSAPILDPELRGREKKLLTGDPGSLVKIGKGCRFCDRCDFCEDHCRKEEPKETDFGDGRIVFCHHPLIDVSAPAGTKDAAV